MSAGAATGRIRVPAHVQRRRARQQRAQSHAVGISGLGRHAPERVLSNADLEQIVETSDAWIFERTGMRERRIAGPDVATSDLATAAARAALADACLPPDAIDLILVATATADHVCPPTAAIVQHRLGATRAAGFDVGAACAGFMTALVTGSQFVRTGTYRHVLVIGADKLSAITDYRDRESCVLFGDGAGAVVLGAGPRGGILATNLGTDGSGHGMITVPAGGSRRPSSLSTVEERQHFLTLRGREVFRFAVAKICEEIEAITRRQGLQVRDLDWLVPHQANQRILEAAARKLGFGLDRVVSNVERFGNTSSASIPMALSEAAQAGRFRDGDLIGLVGFGGGLSWGTALVRW